ncbi:hypothetical protein J6590_006770 [Homalodisca vitripennis]|nr:hypothetical protein J6590_099547 [Homalodisca vitripennis]KAG8313210.1 hypothetical protein J6590_006770 [Homalodisca vitripennis]
MEDELMLDKIVCSIKDLKLQERLWLKKDVILVDTVQKWKSNKETKQQNSKMQDLNNEINKIHAKSKIKTHESKQKNKSRKQIKQISTDVEEDDQAVLKIKNRQGEGVSAPLKIISKEIVE